MQTAQILSVQRFIFLKTIIGWKMQKTIKQLAFQTRKQYYGVIILLLIYINNIYIIILAVLLL